MKGKAILRSLLLAYGVTGLFLLILAFLLFQFEFGGGTAAVGIIIIYVVSCLVGGFMAGKIIRKDRYIWGIVTGLSYYVLLLLVSFLAQGKWDMTFAHALTTFFMCLGGGAIGGLSASVTESRNSPFLLMMSSPTGTSSFISTF